MLPQLHRAAAAAAANFNSINHDNKNSWQMTQFKLDTRREIGLALPPYIHMKEEIVDILNRVKLKAFPAI